MPQPVDVGSVLGGRYKVTAYVLASADRDLVLDGMDQVLNRPVSILVAAASNADQIAATAREVATGERAGNIQVLDLGVTDESTYLVTNRAAAADLLDLVVPQDEPAPSEDEPFVEPFFTDTLGSEIFGGPRSTEPETYDDDDDYVYDDEEPRAPRKSRLPKARLPRFGRNSSSPGAAGVASTAGVAGGAAVPGGDSAGQSSSAPSSGPQVPPPPSSAPRVTDPGSASSRDQPKVSLWEDSDYESDDDVTNEAPGRPASRFPAAAAAGGTGSGEDSYDLDDEDDDRGNNPKYTRVLVGVVLAIILVTVVALAANQLTGSFGTDPAAGPGSSTTQAEEEPTDEGAATPTQEGEETAEPSVEPVAPVPTAVTRLVPDNAELNAESDADLPQIIDGNPGSFWGSLVFANETFGGLAQNMALVVELEEESTINQIQIQQLNGSGGSFTVLLNDEPTLEGADQIAQSSFTGPTINIPVPPGADGEPATAQYIIVNLTQLPRLTNVQAVFPWGVRIAEISAS
ncbi:MULTISPECIES: ABC transporter substrate-binding protein [unclassified Arthrobacter]|uniref:ABC transporter substrate-binding protein n=1 Tax=unclassified Arthrobacter TaxID=235627 RepID=UPI0014909EFC|nr:ABC transporter substrate-binding protein [Arthrobacter sp. AET 35A]MBE0008504.1 ABC transporter substrate-binding protein [Arthrobacter sp. AET 35A]NOJ62244.1 ABC transporter substrate-binding protein [Arthrobacter sp. 147(2020)]